MRNALTSSGSSDSAASDAIWIGAGGVVLVGVVVAVLLLLRRKPAPESDDTEDVVQMDRTGCFFHTGRPDGMDSYSPYVSQGMEQGYREAFPEVTFRIVRCMGEGTSTDGCTLRFRLKKSGGYGVPEKVSSA